MSLLQFVSLPWNKVRIYTMNCKAIASFLRCIIPLFCLVLVLSACTTVMDDRETVEEPRYGSRVLLKPTVAVTDFENRANFNGRWKLGYGLAEMFTTELLDTGRFTVLERERINGLLDEIMRQGRNLFRPEGRVEQGRLKNTRYLISGAVTDFTVTGDLSGWFGVKQAKAKGRGSVARVALNVKVIDVESGEIITSVQKDAKASSGFFGAEINYKKMSFGGEAFFQSPLGRATRSAMRKTLKRILKELPREYWQPRIAEAGPDEVVINGGENVNLKEGVHFSVRDKGRDITDPITGNIIETVPGKVIGHVQVTEVKRRSARGIILDGKAYRGCFLEPGTSQR